jgi:hypothetical protein
MYTLGRACTIVRKLDSSPGRLSAFDQVLRRSTKVRVSYLFYQNAPETLKSLLLLLYGMKCYLSVNWTTARDADIVLFASYPNEHVAVGHVRQHLKEWCLGELSIATRNCLRPDALLALPAFLLSAIRFQRVARRLSRRLHFMPACRVFSTIAYYARFRRLLRTYDTSAVFIANHYSPECLGLAVAAHQAGKKVIFANHANATWESGFVPPLFADLAAVTGQAVLDVYLRSSGRPINAVFIPPAPPQAPLRARLDPDAGLKVGIFLTALTNKERLRELVDQLKRDSRIRQILIRPHPVEVINEDISDLITGDGRVVDTNGTLLSDNARECDLAICGNSTAAVEILRAGLPVLYDSRVDYCGHDFNGYLKRGLVMAMPDRIDASSLEAVARFYGAPAWTGVMRNLDASYGRDEAAMFERLNHAIAETIAARHRAAEAAPLRPLGRGLAAAAPLKT